MSRPVSACLINRAAKEGGEAYERLKKIMFYNLECGHWTVFPCQHEPSCEPATEEQFDLMNSKLTKEWEASRK